MGQDTGQSSLAEIDVTNFMGDARVLWNITQVTELKQKAKLGGEEIGQHLVCLIRYFVYPGREAEALKYLQDGFDQNISKELMSPLQFITKKVDEDEIESSIYSEPGAICVRYKFPLDEELAMLAEKVEQFDTLNVKLQLKGFVSHSHKNRTNVKVDYAYLNVIGDEMPKSELITGLLG